MLIKTCVSCGQTKSISDFYQRKQGSKDGFHGQCKHCIQIKNTRWVIKKKPREEKQLLFDFFKPLRKKYPRTEEQKERKRILDRSERYKASRRRYDARRRANGHKRHRSITARISLTLKSQARGYVPDKSLSTTHEKLLGCSIQHLKSYLESHWLAGMTWDNYGRYKRNGPMTWHIDHIRPLHSFDLADPEEQKICFHYSNLQPLWAIDNIKKGANW